ncbi:hypothetical protein BsWGS_05492 [Bradybaena similaris]
MANPRKFSEKIALHTQKQAEETAAFEAILQEVKFTRDPLRFQKQQHIAPSLGTYRAGSLPNVNQMSAKQGIDLQATLQQIDDLKQGKSPMLHSRHDRQRQQIGPHRRNFPADKRIDSSPYGSSYHLSPPPDTSWRSFGLPKMHRYLFNGLSLSRVHSDPSLHMNAMGNASSNNYSHPPVTPPSHRRIIEMVGENVGDGLQMNYWDSKKMNSSSRPKSCEVPNINIYPSHEHDSNNSPAPVMSVTSNNTGSLPDLSVLQFPSPLATPLDQEDPYNTAGAGTPVSLSPTSPHHMPIGHQSQQSPGQRRRHGSNMSLPSPLVLNQAGMADMDPCMQQQYMFLQQQQQLQLQQMRHRGTNSPLSQPYPSPISPLYSPPHHRSLNNHRQATKPQIPSVHQHISSPTSSPTHSSLSSSQHNLHQSPLTQSTQQQQHQSPLSPPVPHVHITSCDDINSQVSMTQYRNSVSDTNCQSPTSPHSTTSYSPVQSPGATANSQAVNSTMSDTYYIQQQQQQQTNALQHQFEQFNMAAFLAMSSADDLFQPHFLGAIDVMSLGQFNSQPTMSSPSHARHINQQNSMSSGSKIPDIILTGADDMYRLPFDFAKDLGNAITGMSDSFDTDFLTNDEAFKAGLDPLDLEEIQMLTDASLVADPAIEDSFKLDRL